MKQSDYMSPEKLQKQRKQGLRLGIFRTIPTLKMAQFHCVRTLVPVSPTNTFVFQLENGNYFTAWYGKRHMGPSLPGIVFGL